MGLGSTPGTWNCTICKLDKPFDAFPTPSKPTRTGYWCKECTCSKMVKFNKTRRPIINEQNKERAKNGRAEIATYKLKGCRECHQVKTRMALIHKVSGEHGSNSHLSPHLSLKTLRLRLKEFDVICLVCLHKQKE